MALVTPRSRPTRSINPKTWRAHVGGNEFRVTLLNDALPYDAVLDSAQSVFEYLTPRMAESLIVRPEFENLIVIQLNTRNRPIGWEVITSGTIDSLLVSVPMIFRSAILANASAIILAHNHPSGDPSPSEADIKASRDLMRAARLMKIDLLDHVILGKATPTRPKGYVSLRELGHLAIS